MVLCDGCNLGWHTFCLQPRLTGVPVGVWLCPACKELGVQPQIAQEPQQQQQQQPRQKRLFVNKATRAADARAESLHGSMVERAWKKGHPLAGTNVRGKLSFRGAQHRPYYFEVVYENGHKEFMTFHTAYSSLVAERTEAGPQQRKVQ